MKVPKLGKAASVPVLIYPAFSSFFLGRGVTIFGPFRFQVASTAVAPKQSLHKGSPKPLLLLLWAPGPKGGKEADPATPSIKRKMSQIFFL